MQSSTSQAETTHKCPYCQANPIKTVATAPFVRGMIIVFQYGSKSFIGCVSCVRKELLKEVGKSAFIGWFSPKALISNPFVMVYNLIQASTISAKPEKVRDKLDELGISENSGVDITAIGYALAVNMINADGKVEEEELQVAEEVGAKIFDNFNVQEFRETLNKKIPSNHDLTIILKDILDDEGKVIILSYLTEIAKSDGHMDPAEEVLINEAIKNLDIDLSKFSS